MKSRDKERAQNIRNKKCMLKYNTTTHATDGLGIIDAQCPLEKILNSSELIMCLSYRALDKEWKERTKTLNYEYGLIGLMITIWYEKIKH